MLVFLKKQKFPASVPSKISACRYKTLTLENAMLSMTFMAFC